MVHSFLLKFATTKPETFIACPLSIRNDSLTFQTLDRLDCDSDVRDIFLEVAHQASVSGQPVVHSEQAYILAR